MGAKEEAANHKTGCLFPFPTISGGMIVVWALKKPFNHRDTEDAENFL